MLVEQADSVRQNRDARNHWRLRTGFGNQTQFNVIVEFHLSDVADERPVCAVCLRCNVQPRQNRLAVNMNSKDSIARFGIVGLSKNEAQRRVLYVVGDGGFDPDCLDAAES